MSSQIRKLLSEGDVVYCAKTGKPMKVTKVCKFGFYTEKKYFSFDDVRKKYYLTGKGYEDSLKTGGEQSICYLKKKTMTV